MLKNSPRTHLSPVRRAAAAALGIGLLAVLAPAAPAAASPTPGPAPSPSSGAPGDPTGKWSATPIPGGEIVQGAKSRTGKLAQSDRSLLTSTSAKPVNVVVKLDYDSLAAYQGDLPGLPGTSPAVTGKELDPTSANARKYTEHIKRVEDAFLTELARTVPDARPGRRLRTVYGGIALTVPGDKADDLLKLPGVAAVQEDRLQKPLTDASPAFVGAPALHERLGGPASAGKGVVVAVIDTGVWPEHPSFADPGNLPDRPPTTAGAERPCMFGDDPTTPAPDPFACNDKLISGQPVLETYNSVFPGELYSGTARDADGHGTHTASIAAGVRVAAADPQGIDRGPIQGIAPAAHVAAYKVCGKLGCFQSDSVAAIAQALLDGVDVINYSITGGTDPYSDPVELAFLDAYAAGVFVAAAAGNEGPDAGTVNHRGPWVTSVAATAQRRTFRTTLTLSGAKGATVRLSGASITAGVTTPLPVVRAADPPYSDPRCEEPAPAGIFTGKIVACERNEAPVLQGYHVEQGGAAGMIVYDPVPSEVLTDNHWLPTVHLGKPEGDALLAFLQAHPGAKASFPQGTAQNGTADRVAMFSGRGPGGDFLKPDLAAPGLHILAGHTPTPETVLGGPPGDRYQALSGTSMATPHVSGAAALLRALHPEWTPGQVRSALVTTATTKVVKSDGTTPADPFDTGGGRIDLTKAGDPGLTLDETAENFAASATDPKARIALNLPTVNAPTMPGVLTVKRTVTNVTGRTLTFTAHGSTVRGAHIAVFPPLFTVRPGKSAKLTITITAPELPDGQYFGQVDLAQVGGKRRLHLPVAFHRKEGAVPVEQTCAPDTVPLGGESTCTVTVRNDTPETTAVTAVTTVDPRLRLTAVNGAVKVGTQLATAKATLPGRQPARPRIAPGTTPAGPDFLPLSLFGIEPTPIGDEQAINLDVPPFVFAGRTYTRIGIVSNGYTVAGGAADEDVTFLPQTLPDAARPNGVLAPYWTDLTGEGAPGVAWARLTDGIDHWLVIEWRVNLYGTTSTKVFQQWIGLNGVEDITFAYDQGDLPGTPPAGYGLTVGAENEEGSAGDQIAGAPTTDLRVSSEPGESGGTLSYTLKVKGVARGSAAVTTGTSTPQVQGITLEVDRITVR